MAVRKLFTFSNFCESVFYFLLCLSECLCLVKLWSTHTHTDASGNTRSTLRACSYLLTMAKPAHLYGFCCSLIFLLLSPPAPPLPPLHVARNTILFRRTRSRIGDAALLLKPFEEILFRLHSPSSYDSKWCSGTATSAKDLESISDTRNFFPEGFKGTSKYISAHLVRGTIYYICFASADATFVKRLCEFDFVHRKT